MIVGLKLNGENETRFYENVESVSTSDNKLWIFYKMKRKSKVESIALDEISYWNAYRKRYKRRVAGE